MTELIINKDFIQEIINISDEAGKSVMSIYNNQSAEYKIKNDNTPLTKADIASHTIIVNRLKDLTPSVPIISEESCDIPFDVRSTWKEYWLVDPLDGTKEFINRNGEFTINIALIKGNTPILGVIYHPAKDVTYWGSKYHGSFIKKRNEGSSKISTSNREKIKRIASSRSHKSNDTNLFIETVGECEIITVGSSLKFCLVASGEVDLYLRYGPTSEWDVAAGMAIVEYAGGYTCGLDGNELKCNLKESYLNQSFISNCSKAVASQALKIIQNI